MLLFRPLADSRPCRPSHFAVLVHDAVDASFLHRLAVVNVLRRKRPIPLQQHLDQQQQHTSCNDDYTDNQRLYHIIFYISGCKDTNYHRNRQVFLGTLTFNAVKERHFLLVFRLLIRTFAQK